MRRGEVGTAATARRPTARRRSPGAAGRVRRGSPPASTARARWRTRRHRCPRPPHTSVNTGSASRAAPANSRSRSAAVSADQRAFEQLANDPEAEPPLQLPAAGAARSSLRAPARWRSASSSTVFPMPAGPRSAVRRPCLRPPRPAQHRVRRDRPRVRTAAAARLKKRLRPTLRASTLSRSPRSVRPSPT